MKPTLTIAKRELSSLFYSPIAYIVLFIVAPLTVLFFLRSFGPNQPATMRPAFEWVFWLMMALALISMRSVSEEFRSGTIELMMTSPVSDAQVVLGKWLGEMGFLCVLLLPLLILVGVLEATARPDYGPIFTGFLGLMLVGGLYLAIGICASAITQHQFIAAIVSLSTYLFLTVVAWLLSIFEAIHAPIRQALFHIGVQWQFEAFSKGLIDLGNVVYFVSAIALFLFMATKILESRRWR